MSGAKVTDAPEVRFWSCVAVDPNSDCWIWGGTNHQRGYGKIVVNRRGILAHRFAYEQLRAEIPAGLVIDHLCRNRACVNPWHMEPVTIAVNVQRGVTGQAARDRGVARTHCGRGHELTVENVYVPRQYPFRRYCKECRRVTDRQRGAAA